MSCHLYIPFSGMNIDIGGKKKKKETSISFKENIDLKLNIIAEYRS